jgi:PAS domain S-box-containing protein
MTAMRHLNLGTGLCLAGAGLGVVGLSGWFADIDALVVLVPAQPAMMPNTAAALVLLGCGGALLNSAWGPALRSLSTIASFIALAIGVLTIAEYALTLPFSIDQILVRTDLGPFPGRPSPPTAVAISLLASAILLFERQSDARIQPPEWLALSAGVIALAALAGQLFGAGPLYELAAIPTIGVAVPTALGLLVIGTGLIVQRPDGAIMRVTTAPGPGAVLVRRLGPPAILVPLMLGVAAVRAISLPTISDIPLVIAVLTVLSIVVSLFLLAVTAIRLNETHAALEQTRVQTRELIDLASEGIFIADLDGRYVDVNEAGCRMLGYSRKEILSKSITDLIPPSDVQRLWSERARLLNGGVGAGEWTILTKGGTYLPIEVSTKILPDGRWQAFVRDISERKRAEDILRHAQERFELALKGADLAAWDWNVRTGEVIFNARWAEMRGRKPADVIPHVDSWTNGMHPEDSPAAQKVYNDCIEGGRSEFEMEYRVATKSGEWIWVLDRGKVFARDENGRATRMVGTELDVTPRKRAEEALRLSEAKFSGIVSISADAIISIDEGQRITLFNEGAEKIFGRSKADAIGATLDILVPERFRARVRRHVESFLAGPDTARRMAGPTYGLRKDGEEFPADAAISKIIVGGSPILTVALRDMTQQKRVESEQRLLAQVGSVLAGTVEFEDRLDHVARLAVGDLADFSIIDIAEADGVIKRARVVGRDPSSAPVCEALMQLKLDGQHPHCAGSVLRTGQPLLIAELTPDIIRSWPGTADQLATIEAAGPKSGLAVPLTARGKVLGALALISCSRIFGQADLSLAAAIAQRAALSLDNARLYRAAQRATQARDNMLGIVAHDLRNPLAAIVTLVAVLRRNGVDKEIVDEMEYAASRMSRLIQDLIDVTRVEAGRLSLGMARISAGEVISESLEAQRPLASAASLELRLDAAEGLPDLSADHDRLLQVFENLIGNAIKFTGPGGQIVVGAKARAGEVLFSVADTGRGIASAHLPHLFNRFWQAPEAMRRGAGLGLPIVKGIVEAHGGRVWVESAPERGSTFFFTIPAARAAAPLSRTAPPVASQLSR